MMTTELADRLLTLLRYVDSMNVEPAGPSRSRDFFLIQECEELTKIISFAKYVSSDSPSGVPLSGWDDFPEYWEPR
jgi:hypothetical protein